MSPEEYEVQGSTLEDDGLFLFIYFLFWLEQMNTCTSSLLLWEERLLWMLLASFCYTV